MRSADWEAAEENLRRRQEEAALLQQRAQQLLDFQLDQQLSQALFNDARMRPSLFTAEWISDEPEAHPEDARLTEGTSYEDYRRETEAQRTRDRDRFMGRGRLPAQQVQGEVRHYHAAASHPAVHWHPSDEEVPEDRLTTFEHSHVLPASGVDHVHPLGRPDGHA